MTVTEHEARELAAHWISPSAADRELTRFATGHSEPDWVEFAAEVKAQRPYADAHTDPDERAAANAELFKLFAYAQAQLRKDL